MLADADNLITDLTYMRGIASLNKVFWFHLLRLVVFIEQVANLAKAGAASGCGLFCRVSKQLRSRRGGLSYAFDFFFVFSLHSFFIFLSLKKLITLQFIYIDSDVSFIYKYSSYITCYLTYITENFEVKQ